MTLLVVPLSCAALAPGAGAAVGVRLSVNGGSTVSIDQADISAAIDVPVSTQATIRDADGTRDQDAHGGTTLAAVVELAGIPRQHVREASVRRDNTSGEATLTGDEVRDGFGGDPSGERRDATVFSNGGTMIFFRPLRDARDVNRPDFISVGNARPLEIALTTTSQTVRRVTAGVSDQTPGPGSPVTFDASVDNPQAGVTFRCSWDFGDGATGVGARASHAYAAGGYRATVTVTGSDGSVGMSDPISIQVGSPSGPTPTVTAAPGPGGASTGDGAGGTGSGGGAATGGGSAGGKQGVASGPQRSRGRGRGGSRGGAPAGMPRPRATATAAPTATATATAAPPAAATAAPTPSPMPPTRIRPKDPAPGGRAGPRRGRDRRTTPGGGSRGTAIDGVLLAGAGTAQDVQRLLGTPAQDSSRAAARRGGGGGPALGGWAAGTTLLLLLLGAGAAREGALAIPRLRGGR